MEYELKLRIDTDTKKLDDLETRLKRLQQYGIGGLGGLRGAGGARGKKGIEPRDLFGGELTKADKEYVRYFKSLSNQMSMFSEGFLKDADKVIAKKRQIDRMMKGSTLGRYVAPSITETYLQGLHPATRGARAAVYGRRFIRGAAEYGVGDKFSQMAKEFIPNLISPFGIIRNLRNITSAFNSLGKAAGIASPLIGVLVSSINSLASIKFFNDIAIGAQLFASNKILNSQSLGQAASDLMKMKMSSKFLGGNYNKALNASIAMSEEFGIDRANALSTMSVLQGLNIGGGKKLSLADAEMLTRASGKIAMQGNKPYSIISTNMQQLFGRTTPSTKDVNELIASSGTIANIATTMASKQGVYDIKEWLKDKANLFMTIAEFDKMFETNDFLRAKGQVAVAKATAMMKIVEDNGGVWKSMSKSLVTFWEAVADAAPRVLKNLSFALNKETIERFVNDIATIATGLVKLGNAISWFANLFGTDPAKEANRRAMAEADVKREGIPENFLKGKSYEERLERRIELLMNTRASYYDQHPLGIKTPDVSDLIKKNDESTGVISNFANGANTDTAQQLSDLTKGSRSLIINFNKEIAPIDVRLGDVQDGTDLGNRLRAIVEEVVTNGLSNALRTASAMA